MSAWGRIIASYERLFDAGPRFHAPTTRREEALATDESAAARRYRAFVEESGVNLFEKPELRPVARRLLADLEGEEWRLRREADLVRDYAARNGLRRGEMLRIDRLEREADDVAEMCDRLFARLNPPAINGQPDPYPYRCSYCNEPISKQENWNYVGTCRDCSTPEPKKEANVFDRIVEAL